MSGHLAWQLLKAWLWRAVKLNTNAMHSILNKPQHIITSKCTNGKKKMDHMYFKWLQNPKENNSTVETLIYNNFRYIAHRKEHFWVVKLRFLNLYMYLINYHHELTGQKSTTNCWEHYKLPYQHNLYTQKHCIHH